MKQLPFTKSKEVSLGVELEFQIIDPATYDLAARAKDLIRNISKSKYSELIKPEITQSMIEINSSIHTSAHSLYHELRNMKAFLLNRANKLDIKICGGGSHPFQKWALTKIFPTKRFKSLSQRYRYLSKRATVFGLHIHIGCRNGEQALYLTHALTRYIPHLIALSASSPFYQGIDTGYHTSRMTLFNSFPTSGVMPFLLTWQEFSNYFYKMRRLGVITSMKDFYWDIRPKPEFGTVEIRVCDTPLTIKKAVLLAMYAQAISYYLLHEKPIEITKNFYYLYNHNRFQASRYGLEGSCINPITLEKYIIQEDILTTIKKIKKYSKKFNNEKFLELIVKNIMHKKNDAIILKEIYAQHDSLIKVVQEQCNLWIKD